MASSGEPVAVIVTALGIGLALAGAPGPVQAVVLSEAVRGGARRGLLAVAGASLAFGLLLIPTALGLSILTPGGTWLQVLQLVGGAFLILLAADALRTPASEGEAAPGRVGLPVPIRGSLAVLLNPGAWIFLGAVAAPLYATAAQQGGTASAVLVGLAIMLGAASGDAVLALVGAFGLRRAGPRVVHRIRQLLALVLGGLGVWLVVGVLL
jgi:threonine/homoserine/homoserine lactone efflux protein